MTVPSRGARVRRGGRRPGWVLLTVLLVLAMGASSALVFTNRVELLKLAVILALWAAVAGAFVSVFYRRQSDADQSRIRDMKLVYDLQLDREISARREYELAVESQLRRELASELRDQGAEEVAALRAELSALRTNLEILFGADLEQRPALETPAKGPGIARAFSERTQNGQTPITDWVSSDRLTHLAHRVDEASIIDVPEEPLLPPRQPAPPPGEPLPGRAHPEEPGRHWAPVAAANTPAAQPSGRRRRARHADPAESAPPVPPSSAPGRRRREVESPSGNFASPASPASPAGPAGPDEGQHADGQSVADLMARLQVNPGGGRRRRRGD